MAEPNKHRRRQRRRAKRAAAPPETPAGDALTVAWTLTVITLAICDLMILSGTAYVRFSPQAERVAALVGLIQFCALVLAVVVMAMLPIVYRVRRTPPPRPFVAFAVIVSCVPLVLALPHALP